MKAYIPRPVHESYRRHRRQRTRQIVLPMVLAAVLYAVLIVLISVAAFRGGGDAPRWAAIATMWIATHVFLIALVVLAVLIALVYLLARLLGIAPTYTGRAQDLVHKLAIHIRRAADLTVKPVFAVNGFGATLRALLGKK